jgi:hypothetical protein
MTAYEVMTPNKAWNVWYGFFRSLKTADGLPLPVLARALEHAEASGWCDGDDPREGVPCEGEDARDMARLYARQLYIGLRSRTMSLRDGDEDLRIVARALGRVPAEWRESLRLLGDVEAEAQRFIAWTAWLNEVRPLVGWRDEADWDVEAEIWDRETGVEGGPVEAFLTGRTPEQHVADLRASAPVPESGR